MADQDNTLQVSAGEVLNHNVVIDQSNGANLPMQPDNNQIILSQQPFQTQVRSEQII